MSPTARSLAYLRAQGYTAAVVERWNRYARIRQDLFGFIDIVALHPHESGVLAIQSTVGAHHAARVVKISSDPKVAPYAILWLKSGNSISVISWAKQGARGCRKLWTPRIQELTLADFVADVGCKGQAPLSCHVGSC